MVLAAANPKREVYFQTFDFSIVQKQKRAERVFSIRIVARNSAFEKIKIRLVFSFSIGIYMLSFRVQFPFQVPFLPYH